MGLFILLIYIAGIGLIRGGAKGNDEIQNAALDSLVSTFWDWSQREWPVYGTMYGFHQYDMFLDNFTESAFTAQKDTAADILTEANLIDEEQLDDKDSVTLVVLKDLLTHFIDGYRYRKYSIYNSQLQPYEVILSRMPKNTLKDYQNILARYRLIGDQIEDIVTLLKEEAKLNGTTMYPTTVMYKVSKAHKFDDKLSEPLSCFLYEPFLMDNMPTDIDSAIKSEMQTEVLELIQQEIKPAVEKYINYLENNYGKVGSVNRRTEPGLHSVNGGLDYYKACLKWHLSTDITPGELHNIGLKEVDRISKQMAEIVKSEGFEGTLSEYMDHLQEDPNNFYNTSEEILKTYETIIAGNHDGLPQVLLKIPDYQMKVVGSRGGSSGSYIYPTLDGSKPGIFTANIENPQEKLIFNMDALTLHEAEPGHHTQFTYAMESDVPLFRKLALYLIPDAIPFNWLFYTAYVEGWALYAEKLGIEMGSYSDPRRLYGKYNAEMYRAVRLVVDTGIHAFGWSMEEAEDYMRNHTTFGESNIKYEIMRYVARPGQACSYKIGEMKILELRKKAEEILGPSFDKREFHGVILNLGPVSLSVMEDQVHRWLNKKSSDVSVSYIFCPSVWLLLICFHSNFINLCLGSTV